MRLIDADELIKKLIVDSDHVQDIPDRVSGICDALIDVYNAPTIEPKHGRWEWNYHNGEYFCSRCEKVYEYNTLEISQGEYRYCPNCGCRMMDEVEE